MLAEQHTPAVSREIDGTLLCLATVKGLEVLRAAATVARGRHLTICSFEEKAVAESFHEKIIAEARRAGFSTVTWDEFRSDPVEFVRVREIRSILCIGWRYLIPKSVVGMLSGKVVIAHDSLLPKLRGFAPLVTAMISGEAETGVTFLRAGTGVDDGEILWQARVCIDRNDTIASLIQKILPLYREGSVKYLRGELRDGISQNESCATYSIWRDEDDYRIDWNQDAETIERTVRALGYPYLGARAIFRDRLVTIHDAEALPDLPFAIRQPGKVWALDPQGCPIVVCGRGLLRVVSVTRDGESILPFRSVRVRFS